MGEYIKHPETGEEIKIGVMDEMFYSRQQLIQWQKEGFKGYYCDEYDNTLETAINNQSTLYKYEEEIEQEFYVPAEDLKHDDVFLYKNGYQWKVNCLEQNNSIIKVKAIGERYNGKYRTIFKCACCGTLLSIDHVEAMLLRNLHPELKDIIKSQNDKEGVEDLSLFETIELLINDYEYKDILRLVGEKGEKEVQKYGYPTLYGFYNRNIKRTENI